jgi:hypothetical protein
MNCFLVSDLSFSSVKSAQSVDESSLRPRTMSRSAMVLLAEAERNSPQISRITQILKRDDERPEVGAAEQFLLRISAALRGLCG